MVDVKTVSMIKRNLPSLNEMHRMVPTSRSIVRHLAMMLPRVDSVTWALELRKVSVNWLEPLGYAPTRVLLHILVC